MSTVPISRQLTSRPPPIRIQARIVEQLNCWESLMESLMREQELRRVQFDLYLDKLMS